MLKPATVPVAAACAAVANAVALAALVPTTILAVVAVLPIELVSVSSAPNERTVKAGPDVEIPLITISSPVA